jgi:putative ABC transport system substrate-binding protein
MVGIGRREFITLVSGVAAWPLAASAQQGRVRRIGVLMGVENDTAKSNVAAFTQALADLGWIDGRNVQMDLRWHGSDINRIRALARELVGLQPDIIVTNTSAPTVALQRETRTIPIVFASVSDPVASGIVPRLNQPGGNVTGFAVLEASLGGKWLELLSEIAPELKRVGRSELYRSQLWLPGPQPRPRGLLSRVPDDERGQRPSSKGDPDCYSSSDTRWPGLGLRRSPYP